MPFMGITGEVEGWGMAGGIMGRIPLAGRIIFAHALELGATGACAGRFARSGKAPIVGAPDRCAPNGRFIGNKLAPCGN